TWNAGEMRDGGTLVIPFGASLAIATNNFRIMRGHTLNNSGTITWTDSGGIRCDEGVNVFNNQAGATLIKSGAGTTTAFGGTFTNSGLVQITSGTLRFTNGSGDGSIGIAQGASLIVPGGSSYSLQTGATVTGLGLLLANGGTLTVGGNASVQNLALTA